MSRVTVADVAKVAQVSATTVSLCFQDESRVSMQTRQRVLKTAAEMGYLPNQFARRLKSGKSRLIALLVAEIHSPSVSEIIAGVERICIENGYNVLVFNTFRDIEIEKRTIQSACELNVEGIIIMACEEPHERLQALCEERFPIVYLNSLPLVPTCSHIVYDMETISRMGTEYLLSLGHRRILLINSEERSRSFSSFARLETTYRSTLQEHGIKPDLELIRHYGTTMRDGYAAVRGALDDGVEFSAIFAVCDEVALGAMDCLEQNGKKVPDDISVLGIDNIEFAALNRIGLTTIEVSDQKKQLGAMAGQIVLRAIEDGPNATTESIVLKPRLFLRDSCQAVA